jgi:CDP-6-deoxy-D-xylo-4-hexulose-3-dehydrase
LLRQPYMKGRNYRVVGDLTNADLVTTNTFWIGLYPGLTEAHLSYAVETISRLVHSQKAGAPVSVAGSTM